MGFFYCFEVMSCFFSLLFSLLVPLCLGFLLFIYFILFYFFCCSGRREAKFVYRGQAILEYMGNKLASQIAGAQCKYDELQLHGQFRV
jgi:hypothetical protein